ncbi:MAG: redoxin domain-containing protein [Frankiaceae bacterium]
MEPTARREQWRPPARLPDLELPDSDGNLRQLSDLARGDPLLLHCYRGWWCPKERQFFRRLLILQDEAEVAYTRFVSLSVDPPEVAAALRAGLDARWTFLSDADRSALAQLGLRETTDTVHHPYLPTCFILHPDLTIAARYDGYWFWGRPTAEQLRADFRDVTRALRPDWTAPAPDDPE